MHKDISILRQKISCIYFSTMENYIICISYNISFFIFLYIQDLICFWFENLPFDSRNFFYDSSMKDRNANPRLNDLPG